MRKFKKIYIEITNICNLSCSFCPKTRRRAQYIDRKLFERIIEEVKGHARFIYFHVLGEPLLHPEIGYFLDLCHNNNLRVNITTNGTLSDRARETILMKPSLRQVNFSLHSFEANISRRSIDEYLDGVFSFIREAREKTNVQICLRLWNLKETEINDKNQNILRKIEEEFSLDYKIEDKLTPCSGIKIAKNVFLNQAMTFKWPDSSDCELEGRGFCYGLRDQAAILVDGTVVPCCLDGEGVMNLGNIKDQSFSSIVESSRSKAIYDGFSRREVVEPLCKKCSYRLRFN